MREIVGLAPVSEKEAVHHGASRFRVIERLVMQIERSLGINDLRAVTKEVVEAARESLNERKPGVLQSLVS